MADGRFSQNSSVAQQGKKSADLQAELDALQYENNKLKTINQVLMQRVELGWGNHSDAYSSFQNAALLAEKVKERTLKLRQTLNKLELANTELSRARQESDCARQQLSDTMESMSGAIVLFDKQRRLVLANARFYEFWKNTDAKIETGVTSFEDITPLAVEHGIFDPAVSSIEKVVHGADDFNDRVFRLTNGLWVQMSERPTADDGLVVVYSDITELQETEVARQQRKLTEKNHILQSTLDNLSQGVALVNAKQQIESWNDRFLELVGLHAQQVKMGVDFQALVRDTEVHFDGLGFRSTTDGTRQTVFEHEKKLRDARVLEIKSHLIAGGGYVNTYTDISERSRNAEALQESERRIRSITNALPALISYINVDRRYEFANKAFEDWFDRLHTDIEGEYVWEVFGPEEYQRHQSYIEQAMQGQVVSFEVEQKLPNNKRPIFHKTYLPHYDAEDRVIGFFALEQDVTERRRTAEALKHAYQHMEQRVYERTKELTKLNQQLHFEIDERAQVEENLLDAKREAEQANISKTKFMAAASHDLLQPLNAARLFATALLDNELPNNIEKLGHSLSSSLHDVEWLLGTLVDISKLEAGVVEAISDTFVVDDLLGNLANEFSQQAASAGLQFKYVPCHGLVYSDSQLLARILRNFLSNAIRYTEHGKLLLGCRRRSDGLEIQVWDTGIGVAASQLPEIFREFQRVGTRRKGNDRGLGLGLAIVDKLSRVLGHEVTVSSWPDKGSVFGVRVPYGNQGSNQQKILGQLNAPQQDPLPGRRILVIDNDEAICVGMETVLSGWGCDVISVLTLDELAENPHALDPAPDLVIADYHLDDGDTGLQAVDLINQRLSHKVPMLIITANYTNELRQQVKDLGYRLLNKPIKPLKLRSAMVHFLS